MAEENKNTAAGPSDAKDKGPSAMMREAMNAYGISPAHVLSSRDYGNHVVIVTKGGAKVSFAPGDLVTKLTEIRLTGVPPPKPRK